MRLKKVEHNGNTIQKGSFLKFRNRRSRYTISLSGLDSYLTEAGLYDFYQGQYPTLTSRNEFLKELRQSKYRVVSIYTGYDARFSSHYVRVEILHPWYQSLSNNAKTRNHLVFPLALFEPCGAEIASGQARESFDYYELITGEL